MEKRLTKEEFLKDLWHPASEMPDKNRTCLMYVNQLHTLSMFISCSTFSSV